jgi:hypothetical protein
VRRGALERREERALGLPWSPALVERGRRSTSGTVHAARDALSGGLGMNLGGGTHHAAYAQGRGYCLFNDVAVAIAALRAETGLGRVLVVDCDVHQGDGTAELLAGDPDSFTLSLHGGANYPFHRATSDLDVDLRSGTGDDEYLAALADALDAALVGVVELGAAEPGDKTIVDALGPGVSAMRSALDAGKPVVEALADARTAAEDGMRATVPMQARKGRASYLGERSVGHQDPGATSTVLILTALERAVAEDS